MFLLKKKFRIFLLVGIFILFFVFVQERFSFAEDPTPTPTFSNSSTENLNRQIKEYQDKITSLQEEKRTLSSQIAIMNSQIQLTQLRINTTEQQLADLREDIKKTTDKIDTLQEQLEEQIKVLIGRIIATYQVGSIRPLEFLLVSNSVPDFLTRANYLRLVQAHDKKLIFETQQTKVDYTNQKEIFEEKEEKVEALKKQLENYTAQLDREKKNKEAFLEVTKNDERHYQDLLARARAEKAAIEGAIATIKLVNGTPVKEGETIAVTGNTGYPYCSTGPHLHFEVRRNGSAEDPSGFLKAGMGFEYSYPPDKYDYYGTINPRGSWEWPLRDGVKINQGYGPHGYARDVYPDHFHNGIDMEDNSNLIKAPKDGTLYKGTASCSGVAMNFVAIDHGEGIISWYWHVR